VEMIRAPAIATSTIRRCAFTKSPAPPWERYA
jgi:hypothetical protein